MATKSVRLKGVRHRRRQTYERLVFLEALLAFLESGYEMEFAWNECQRVLDLKSDWPMGGPDPEGASGDRIKCLLSWESDLPPAARPYFKMLTVLHQNGLPKQKVIERLSAQLRRCYIDDMEEFTSRLPTRLGAGLLIFFLPPALLLLLAPLCAAFLRLQ